LHSIILPLYLRPELFLIPFGTLMLWEAKSRYKVTNNIKIFNDYYGIW